MNREEITEKLIQMMTAESEWVKTGIELEEVHNGIRRVAEGVAPHVERLLADEQEKVREMCCKAICPHCATGLELSCRAHAIRQLDLTKDLAPSSTEEEKGNG